MSLISVHEETRHTAVQAGGEIGDGQREDYRRRGGILACEPRQVSAGAAPQPGGGGCGGGLPRETGGQARRLLEAVAGGGG